MHFHDPWYTLVEAILRLYVLSPSNMSMVMWFVMVTT